MMFQEQGCRGESECSAGLEAVRIVRRRENRMLLIGYDFCSKATKSRSISSKECYPKRRAGVHRNLANFEEVT